MASSAELAILITGDASRAQKALQDAGGGMGGFVKTAGLAVAAFSVAAGAALGTLAVTGINAASDLGESLNKVNVVFGDAAGEIEAFASTSAQALGQSKQEALAAAGTFGNLFVSMGLGQGESADLSKGIVTLGSDLASFNNIDPAIALDKLRAGLVGETEPLRQLGVNMNAAMVETKAMELGLAATSKELTEADKVQARYALILEQTATAQGDFANTSTGMANSTRIISASFQDIQAQIGEKLLPVIAPLISQFATALPGAFAAIMPVVDAVTGAMSGLVTGGIKLVMDAVEGLRGLWLAFTVDAGGMGIVMDSIRSIFGDTVADAIQPFVQAFMEAIPAIKQFASDVGSFIGGLGGVFQDVLKGDIGAAIDSFLELLKGDAATGIATSVTTWAKNFVEWVAPMASDLLGKLRETAFKLLTWIVDQAPDILSKLQTWVQSFLGWVLPMLPKLLEQFFETRKEILNWVLETVPKLTAALGDWATEFIEWVAPLIPPLIQELLKVLQAQIDWIVESAPKLIDTFLGEWLPAALKWVTEAAKLIVPELLLVLENVLNFLVENGPTLTEKFLSEWLPAAIAWVAKAAIDILPELLALLGAITVWIVTVGVPKLAEFALKMGGAVVSGILQGLANLGGQLMDSISSAIRSIRIDIGPFHLSADGFRIDSPPPVTLTTIQETVSRFITEGRAHGGSVFGGTPYLVGERGPELFVPGGSGAIVPNNRLGSGGGTTINLTVQGTVLTPGDLVDAIHSGLIEKQRRNGSLGLA